MDVSKQSVLRQGRQGTQHAAKGDIATGLKTGRGPVEKSHAAQTRSSGRVQAVPISAAASRVARVDLSVAAGGCAMELFSGVGPPGWGAGPDQSSLLNGLAERVGLEAQFLGDFPWAQTSRQQLLCLGRDLGREHRGPARRTRRVECSTPPAR